MNRLNANRFGPPSRTSEWPGLERGAMPSHSPIQALADLAHGCSENPTDRSVATAMFVISCCQLADKGLTPRTPSMIGINAHGFEDDPVDDFVSRLVTDADSRPPHVYHTGAFALRKPEEAPQSMEYAVLQMREIEGTNLFKAEQVHALESLYFDAQRSGFGSGRCRPYASAWHAKFGLLSERDGRMILRLRTREDGAAFRKDVVAGSKRLLAPAGFGAGLKWRSKQLGVSGVIEEDLWDADFARGMVNLPLPLVVVPHATKSPLKLPDTNLIKVITGSLHHAFPDPIEEPDNFVPHPWFSHYAAELRKRLRHLPGDYEHTMQRLARQLFPVCQRLVSYAAHISPQKPTSPQERESLALDLSAHTLRCLTLSVAGLACHGLGFDTGCPHEEVARVLHYIRQKPPMTSAELLRKAHLKNKGMRDVLIGRFLEEDLVRMDGEKIQPTTFLEFVEALHARKELSPPPSDWSAATTKRQSAE
jgi:hypothetical protein